MSIGNGIMTSIGKIRVSRDACDAFMSTPQRNKPNSCFHFKKYTTVETKFYMQLVQICLKYTTGLSLSESVQKLYIT